MSVDSMKRLDNCTWAVQHMRIETPRLSTPGEAYELSSLIAKTLSGSVLSKIQKTKELLISIKGHPGSLNGLWLLTVDKVESLMKRLLQWIPFLKVYPSHEFVPIHARRPIEESFIDRIRHLVMPLQAICINGQVESQPIESSIERQSFALRLKQKNFSDPYTQVATAALQTLETEFVSEKPMQGSTRLALDPTGTRLCIKLISVSDDPEENRRTIRQYREFLLEEYGTAYVEYAQYAYGFDLDDMIQRALPLLPDHVFKMNVGVSNIEMSHLEDLYQRLNLMRTDLALHPMKKSFKNVLHHYHGTHAPVRFSMREIRGLASQKEVVDEPSLQAFLSRLSGVDSLLHLQPELFHALVSLVWPSKDDLPRLLTGRQITHLAICGYKTMGNPNQTDPSRDQAELLQICPDLQKNDWDNFYELLAHVVSKKGLFREYPGSKWRTGVIIPAPCDKDGISRWYYVAKVLDDGKGNLNYILLPANQESGSLPMIHLYRSTNSDQDEIDSMGSIENDLNPEGSPGSSGEEISKDAKRGVFFHRTIPLWVGYLISGDRSPTREVAIQSYRTALHELEKSAPSEKQSEIRALASSSDAEKMRVFLLNEADAAHELPKDKIAQDLVFIGHSLGGALAQYGVDYFGPAADRIPCPGANLICRAYNGPATNTRVDQQFMEFGRKHRELIVGLGQKWRIFHQFEYGDLVPEAGESHLGTDVTQQDSDWLGFHAHIFRPQEGAHALSITTCPTHGRRIGEAENHIDYQLNELDSRQLTEYDHAWKLSGNLKELFGYRILVSPRITEIWRRFIGLFSVPLMRLGTAIYHVIHPEDVKRNRKGVFSCEYHAALW